nr:proline-rich protein 36-like [Aegilops tauschii subsp. strangulata]
MQVWLELPWPDNAAQLRGECTTARRGHGNPSWRGSLVLALAHQRLGRHAVLTWRCWERMHLSLGPLHHLTAFFVSRRRPARRVMPWSLMPWLGDDVLPRRPASVSGLLCPSVRLGDHCFHSLPARSPPAAPERYPGPGFLLLRASAADGPRPSPPPHARVLRSSATDSPAAPMTGCVARLARRLVLPFSSGRAARRRLRRLRRVRLRPAAVTPPPSPRDRQPAPRLRGRLPCVPGRRGPSALPHGRLPRWPAPPATRLRLPRPAPVLAGSACHPASPESPRLRLASRPRLLRLWARPARGVHRIDVRFIRLHSRQLRLGRGREAPASSSPARGRVAPAGSAPARGRLRLAPPASPPRLARLRPLPGRLRPRPCASPPSGRARRSTIVPDQLFRPRLQPSPPPPLPRRVPAAAFCRDSPAGCCRAPASCDGQLHPATRPAGSARTGFTGDPACRLRGGRLLSPVPPSACRLAACARGAGSSSFRAAPGPAAPVRPRLRPC